MKLYVGNLPYTLEETELQAWFTEHGVALDSITLMRDRFTGNLRGFGFIEIYEDETAIKAIESCNGQDCNGRPLVINEARPKVPSFDSGGGFDQGPGDGGRPGRGDRDSGKRKRKKSGGNQRW
jgi:RNA recognition motif-containing protein